MLRYTDLPVLEAAGVEIGAHSHTHRQIDLLPDGAAPTNSREAEPYWPRRGATAYAASPTHTVTGEGACGGWLYAIVTQPENELCTAWRRLKAQPLSMLLRRGRVQGDVRCRSR